jgi:hypothetical protein
MSKVILLLLVSQILAIYKLSYHNGAGCTEAGVQATFLFPNIEGCQILQYFQIVSELGPIVTFTNTGTNIYRLDYKCSACNYQCRMTKTYTFTNRIFFN